MPDTVKKSHKLIKILGIVAALIIAAIAAIPFLFDANQFRPRLESQLTSALGREVKVGNLKLSLYNRGVAADEIVIADDPAFSRSAFVRAQSLKIGVELKPLIVDRTVHITRIILEKPEITLIRAAAGNWNFSTIGGKSDPKPRETSTAIPSPEVTVSLLQVTDGRVTMIHAGERTKPHVYSNVEIKAHDLSIASAFPFSMTANLPGGGSLKLEGKAGPLNNTDASLTPLAATIVITHFDLVASGFIEPDSGLAGLIDFNGSLTSDGKQAQSKGRARAEKLQLVKTGSPTSQPVLLDYTVNHHLKNQSGAVKETKVEFGKATAHLSGSYDMHGESTLLKMKLRGEGMPAEDLEALLPAIGVTLPKGASLQGGTLSADLTAEGPIQSIVTTGQIGILKSKLAGFDLGAKMATIASMAGIKPSSATEIEKFASDIRLAPNGIQASNLLLIVPSIGQLNGDGSVGANNSLDFKMLARLNASGGIASGLARLAGAKAGGDISIPFFIRGTTSNPSFVPDVEGAAKGLLGSAFSGKDAKTGENSQGQVINDAIRNLLGKKKKN